LRKLAVLVVAIAALSVTAAQAATHPALTLSVSGAKVLYGHTLAVSGRLSTGKAGKIVTLLSRRFGTSAPTEIATVKTGAGGRWSRRIKPTIETSYQARSGSAVSRSVEVDVKPAVTVSQLGDGTIWTHIAAGHSFTGQSVELQLQAGATWTTIAKATLDAQSSAVFGAPISTGSETVRIAMSVNQAGSGFLGANSNPLLYQSSFVTLTPTSPRVLYGATIELTGRVSSRQANQIVTLLGWKYGHSAPTRSTTVVTRAGGYWNTSDKPVIRTTYQAQWSGNESAKIVIGVQPAVTVKQLASGGIWTHVAAGHSLTGTIVQLQLQHPGGVWATIDQLPLKPNGNVTFPAPGTSGTQTLRIAMSVNQAGAGYLGATSHTLLYRTKFVSIAAGTTKVLFGNAVVLSGQISGLRSGEAITILGWKYGHSAPAKIGTVKTGPGGHWTFKVSPRIQTGYAARWASSDSDRVLIGVQPLATLTMLTDGRISTHIAAGRSFTGQKVQLQQFTTAGGWQTIEEMPLNANSSVIFPALSTSASPTLRIAMSVNQTGVGFLGTTSHEFVYRA
jgi:hypothetical protein